MLTRTQLFDLGVELLTPPVACYFFNRSYPAPNLTHMMVITLVDAIVRNTISITFDFVAENLSARNGYIVVKEYKRELTNRKFYYLTDCCSIVVVCLLPIFYRVLGQKVGLQIPHYLLTSIYLLVAIRATSLIINASRFVRASFQKPEQKPA
ncbi:MAG TPA: hypothetical protein VMR37_00405 [Rhabdochlamydiaceae bacterium]|nr:hypothetical protein [Rhabdochlamydiaceae bacterium]